MRKIIITLCILLGTQFILSAQNEKIVQSEGLFFDRGSVWRSLGCESSRGVCGGAAHLQER